MENKSYFMKNYRIANMLLSLLTETLIVTAIILNDSPHLFMGIILPILIASFVILLLSLCFDYFIGRYYKYSWVRSLNKQRKHKSIEQESYNLYPIDPRLAEKGLTKEQNEFMIRFRIFNFLFYCGTTLAALLLNVDFNGLLWTSIILPSIMIAGGIGVIFVLIDIIEEFFVKKFYIKRKNQINFKKSLENSKLYKNSRIFYIPICLIIGIIILIVMVDFDKPVNKLIPIGVGVIMAFLFFIAVIDISISLVKRKISKLSEEKSITEE